VIFNNPERRNAMSLEMREATTRLMSEYAKDDSIRVVVLSGAGDKAFVAGADISKFGDERSSEEGVKKYNDAVEAAYASVHEFPKPTIAMIRASALAAAWVSPVAATCALLPKTRFAVPAAKLGLWLRLSADGHCRPVLHQGNLLHRTPVRRDGSGRDGPRQSRCRKQRTRILCEGLCGHDCRQCAADGGFDQVYRWRSL
jgi:hypothetical protein